MLPRVLEPEVMDTPEEARDYDAMDHTAVNRAFCEDMLAVLSDPKRVLDIGTGTARIPIELCALSPGAKIVAIDLAEHMLALAKENITRAGLASRVNVAKLDAKALPYPDGSFGAVVSNSIIHHIPEPAQVLAEMWRVTSHGGLLFVRDLHRPETEAEIDRLVTLHGGERPSDPAAVPSFEHQRSLFRASLAAALTVSEIVAFVAPLGIPAAAVRQTSDRHWTLSAVKP